MKLTAYHKNIVDYYEATENAYKDSWDLDNSLAIHYGYWDEKVRTFPESLSRMNEVMIETAAIKSSDQVLDTGFFIGRLYFKNSKPAVFRDRCIVTSWYRFLIFCIGRLNDKFVIPFLYINGIHYPFTIITDHSFTNALPAIIDGMIKRLFLRQ